MPKSTRKAPTKAKATANTKRVTAALAAGFRATDSDDQEASVCSCDLDLSDADLTRDEDLPAAFGGVEGDFAARK